MNDAEPGAPRHGFLLVDKASGWTSHDVVAKVRGLVRLKRVGHAGTLDPMATGLLVLGLGRATRLLRFVQGAPKEYLATACFGVATDSLDADGSVLAREPMNITVAEVTATAERFVGTISQIPPMVSARKVAGRRLYDLAREGADIEREARPVTIHELVITDFAPGPYPEVSFKVRCSSGTYVRTLADDIAASLGGRAHLTALRRTANGSLRVEDAHTVEEVAGHSAAGTLGDIILTPAQGLPDVPSVVLSDDAARAVRNGVAMQRSALGASAPAEGPVRLVTGDGELVAVHRIDGGRSRPEAVLG